jgi:transposase
MNLEAFYQRLLKPPEPWRVSSVKISEDGGRVDVWLEHSKYTFLRSKCLAGAPTHDHMPEREWRHLDTCESMTFLHARLPRVSCPEHGVVQGAFPLADDHVDLTCKLEAHCIKALLACDRTDAARLTGVSWERLGGVMERAVERGKLRRGNKFPELAGLDEKQVFARHKYFTIITDLQNRSVFDVIDKRSAEAVAPYFGARREELKNVAGVAMDMSADYAKTAAEYMPGAQIFFDHFHVIQLVNKAVDEVRREEQRLLPEEDRKYFFRSRHCFLYGAENLPEKHRARFEKARAVSKRTSRAWAIKECLRELWSGDRSDEEAAAYFKSWHWWATHSRLEPLRKAANSLKSHWAGIAAAIKHGISNALTEGINSKIEAVKRDACGFRNKGNFMTAIMFHCGKLDLSPEMRGVT